MELKLRLTAEVCSDKDAEIVVDELEEFLNKLLDDSQVGDGISPSLKDWELEYDVED